MALRRSQRSRTAQYVAQTRALLTAKGVLDDPYAADMCTPAMKALTALLCSRPFDGLSTSPFFAALATRMQFFDTAVIESLNSGVEQVVIIGAGYDSRAWRLARPGVTYYELDHPATQDDKRRRAPPGGPVYVPADLAERGALQPLEEAGLDWTKQVLFVIEGVTMYLSGLEVRALLSELACSAAPQSRLAINFAAPPGTGTRTDRRRQRFLRGLGAASGEPHRFFLRASDVEPFVAETGWRLVKARTLRELAPELLGSTKLRIEAINPEAATAHALCG